GETAILTRRSARESLSGAHEHPARPHLEAPRRHARDRRRHVSPPDHRAGAPRVSEARRANDGTGEREARGAAETPAPGSRNPARPRTDLREPSRAKTASTIGTADSRRVTSRRDPIEHSRPVAPRQLAGYGKTATRGMDRRFPSD